jgi:hypothetical protein
MDYVGMGLEFLTVREMMQDSCMIMVNIVDA